MLLAFTTRRMVRSAHLALSPIGFTALFDFGTSNRYSHEKIHTASLGTARWADLGTRHQIKPSPKCSDLHIILYSEIDLVYYLWSKPLDIIVIKTKVIEQFVHTTFMRLCFLNLKIYLKNTQSNK